MNNNVIRLREISCFEEKPFDFQLARTNFIYGPNGTGKSSIARKLGQLDFEPAEGSLDVELFNQDYIHRFIDPDSSIPGVFTVRAGSPEVQKRLQQLEGDDREKGEIALADQRLKKLEASLHKQCKLIDDAKQVFVESLWKLKGDFSETLHNHGFQGFLGSKKKFSAEVERRSRLWSENLETEDPEMERVLEQRLSALAAPDSSGTVAPLEPLPEIPLLPESVTHALAKRLSEDSSNSLSALIGRLGNSEWVRQGIDHLNHSDGLCPFCQKQIESTLDTEIRALFDSEYESAKTSIEMLKERIQQLIKDIDASREMAETIQVADTSGLEKLLLELRIDCEKTSEPLGRKLADMSIIVRLEQIEFPSGTDAEWLSVNQAISKHNSDLADRTKSLKLLKNDIWNCFLNRTAVREAYSGYTGKISAPTRASESLGEKISDTKAMLRDLRAEYDECKGQLTSANDVKDDINRNLRSLGFQSFHLELFGDDDRYRIVRADGQVANYLSEGEKTLISFLYFYQYIEDLNTDKSDDRRLWVVLDDPISSLDSQSLTAISHLCRQLARKCTDSSGRLERFFLLTHNAYFYEEVIFEGSREKEPDASRRLYGLIRKSESGYSEIKFDPRNQIESVYEMLWRDVREAQSGTLVSASLQNAMRRILEVYFRLVGGVEEEVIDRLPMELQMPAQWLISWVNDGSHKIRWDLDSAPTNIDNMIYFKAFKEIFYETGQSGHYELMMQKGIPTNIS